MARNANTTGYARIDAVIEHATRQGLIVEVNDRTEDGVASISVEIHKPVDPERTDALAQMDRGESVWLHWCWVTGNGRNAALRAAKHHRYFGMPRTIKTYRELRVIVGMMGESLRRDAEVGR